MTILGVCLAVTDDIILVGCVLLWQQQIPRFQLLLASGLATVGVLQLAHLSSGDILGSKVVQQGLI